MPQAPDERPPDAEFEERRKKTIWQRLDEIDQECATGHKRLRTRIEQLETQADALDGVQNTILTRVEVLERTPPDVTKLRFSTGVVVSIVFVTVSMVGGAYGISNRVMNRIDALASEMTRQAEDDKKDRANLARLNDERNDRYGKSLDTLTRQVELLKYEQQRLREDVTKKNGSTR